MTFINLAMWEKRNNWTKQVIIQHSGDVDENRMSAVYLEACSQLHKLCVHNTLDWLRLKRASSLWLNVMSDAMRLLTSANLRIAFIYSFKAGFSHRHPRRSRGDCAERHRRDPPVHLQVEWGGEQLYVGDLELPVESAWQPVLQISVRGKSSSAVSAPGFPQLQDVFLWLCYLRWHMKKCLGSQLTVTHASILNASIPCPHLLFIYNFCLSFFISSCFLSLIYFLSAVTKHSFRLKLLLKWPTQLPHNCNRKQNISDLRQRAWTIVVTFSEHH